MTIGPDNLGNGAAKTEDRFPGQLGYRPRNSRDNGASVNGGSGHNSHAGSSHSHAGGSGHNSHAGGSGHNSHAHNGHPHNGQAHNSHAGGNGLGRNGHSPGTLPVDDDHGPRGGMPGIDRLSGPLDIANPLDVGHPRDLDRDRDHRDRDRDHRDRDRDLNARDLGSRDLGARDLGSRDHGGSLGIANPLDLSTPLDIGNPLDLGSPLDLAGPLDIASPIASTLTQPKLEPALAELREPSFRESPFRDGAIEPYPAEPRFPSDAWLEAATGTVADHPLMRGLLLELPPKGSTLHAQYLDRWFEAARSIIELLYRYERDRG